MNASESDLLPVHHWKSTDYSVERYTPARKTDWDAFVRTAKNATFLFHRDYMDYHGDRFVDHSLLIFHGKTLMGLLPANLATDSTLVSHAGLTYGGLMVPYAATLLTELEMGTADWVPFRRGESRCCTGSHRCCWRRKRGCRDRW